MKAGKCSDNGKLRPMDSQKENSTGALEGIVGLGSRGRQSPGSASASL